MQIVKTGSLLAFFVWSQILLMAWPFSHDQSHSHGHTFRMTMSANRGAEAASSPGFLKVVAQEMMDLFEGNGVQLRSHPGYAFSLGCNEWKASGLRGNVEGISSSWMETDVNALSTEQQPIREPVTTFARWDMCAFAESHCDVPALRLSVVRKESEYCVYLDYIHRVDIMQHMSYFDKYYKGLDNWRIDQERRPTVRRLALSHSQLENLLASPFCCAYTVNDDTILRGICAEHVKRYTQMLSCSNTLPSRENAAARDVMLLETIFQDLKFKFASIMGGDFAPFASEIAASIVGPREIQ